MKKACSGCTKQIPEAAQHCVFCGAKQESQAAVENAESPRAPSGDAAESSATSTAVQIAPQHASSSRAGVTMLGLRVDDIQAELKAIQDGSADAGPAGAAAEVAAPSRPMPLDPTPTKGLPVVEGGTTQARASAFVDVGPFAQLARVVMGSGGLVLVALFLLPWRGASSWDLLETLAGADYVRQLYFLAGGAVLLANAVAPVPLLFRASVGALVAALPLVLGAEGLLDGWRGIVAALAVIVLPATHLLRMRPAGAASGPSLDGLARGLVVLAAALVALLYLVPTSQVVPLAYVLRLLGSGSVASFVVGLFISIPLVLAALSLLGALGRDLTSAAVLLAVIILLWAPAAVVMFIDDGTQLYVAPALLWTSTTAALCTAQLLSFAARGASPVAERWQAGA